MKRILLRISYDGTAYHGFQMQENAPTVTGVLYEAYKALTGESIDIICGSRTDTGVHALCNIAVFDTESTIPAERLPYALNAHLPEDIRVYKGAEVSASFNPHSFNTKKTYEYRILCSEFLNPQKRLYYHHTTYSLDTDKMRQAAEAFIGVHDFKAFCSAGAQVKSTVRTIYEFTVTEITSGENETDIIIRVTGNGFLYNMVRIIAGTLIEVGRGAIAPYEIARIIEKRDRKNAGPTAPACALTLVKYEFIGNEAYL